MGWKVQRAVVAGLFVCSAADIQATILVFNEQRGVGQQSMVHPAASGGTPPADYGDYVSAAMMAVPGGLFTYGESGEGFTPNVSVDIFSAAATSTDPHVRLWNSGYGDLENVIFAAGPGIAGSPLLSVRLAAATGYVVDLYGFDLAGFGVDYTIAGVSVIAGASTLHAEINVLIEGDQCGPRHTSFAFAEPLSAAELLIQIDLTNLPSGVRDNIGLDNLRFGQTPPGVPEPATFVLTAIAVAAFFSAALLLSVAGGPTSFKRCLLVLTALRTDSLTPTYNCI